MIALEGKVKLGKERAAAERYVGCVGVAEVLVGRIDHREWVIVESPASVGTVFCVAAASAVSRVTARVVSTAVAVSHAVAAAVSCVAV